MFNGSPPAVPQVSDLKSMESQLSLEKKIMSISFFDNFLQWYEIQMFGLVFERLFHAQNQIVSSAEYQTKLTKLQVNLKIELKKIFLWFFFQWKLRFHTFQIWSWGDHGGTCGDCILVFVKDVKVKNFGKSKVSK